MAQNGTPQDIPSNAHMLRKRGLSQRKYKSTDLANYMRQVRKRPESQKEFVERMRNAKSAECIFVPNTIKGRPAKIVYCDRPMTAARYMALLTFGTPRHNDAVVRHLCGNGHLSCVNPAHLEWGSDADNRTDAGKHRGCETAQDKIHAANGRK